MRLSEPYAPLLGNMAAKSLYIVDADELLANQGKDDQGNDDRGITWGQTHSVCTGPYMIESWDAEQRLVIKANPEYWGGHDGVQPLSGASSSHTSPKTLQPSSRSAPARLTSGCSSTRSR